MKVFMGFLAVKLNLFQIEFVFDLIFICDKANDKALKFLKNKLN